MKIIRWWGMAAFLLILATVSLAYYLLAPILIANGIEEIGTEAWGAKVEVHSVELALFPVSVRLNHLVATNPDRPMENILDTETITFSVNSETLLWKKFVIDEMTIDGVKTGTKRNRSGYLEGGRKSMQSIEQALDLSIPEVGQKDIKKIVADADLLTLQRIKTLKSSQQKIEREWQEALDKQAFEKRSQEIQQEYDRLSGRLKENKLNIIKDSKDWKKLKKRIDAERKQIADLFEKIKRDRKLLAQQFNLVKKGPKDDVKALLEQFGLDSGVEGLVSKYIGQRYTPYVMQVLEMAKGFKTGKGEIAQGTEEATIQVGDKVYFKDLQNFPDILIKKVRLSGSDKDWSIDGNGLDLGYLPWLTGKPAKVNLQLQGTGTARVNLSSYWQDKNTMNAKLKMQVDQWKLSDMLLMQSQQGRWLINSGKLNANINGDLTLKNIHLMASFQIDSPKLSVPQGLPDWQTRLADSISKQEKIDFKLTAKGNISDPKIKISSSLEDLFKKAMGDEITQKASQLSAGIEKSVNDKVGDISDLDNFEEKFSGWKNQLGNKDMLMKNLMGKIKI